MRISDWSSDVCSSDLKGVLNIVTSSDPVTAGEMLTKDPRVDLVSFTGSTAVGKQIMANGAETLKRVFLELGGKSVFMVIDDVPEQAFTMVIAGSRVVRSEERRVGKELGGTCRFRGCRLHIKKKKK